MGRRNNQNFVNLPLGHIADKLEYLCERNNNIFHRQEESYTSKSDFFRGDPLPVYDPKTGTIYAFSGTRISRGQYRPAIGKVINADINGSLNILKKSNIVYLTGLLKNPNRLRQPTRVKIA